MDIIKNSERKKSIINSLDLQSENIECELENRKVSVEELLSAILNKMKPFSQMIYLHDIYKAVEVTSNNKIDDVCCL